MRALARHEALESGEYNAGNALYSHPGSTTASKFEIYGFAAFEAESLLFNAHYALNAIDHMAFSTEAPPSTPYSPGDLFIARQISDSWGRKKRPPPVREEAMLWSGGDKNGPIFQRSASSKSVRKRVPAFKRELQMESISSHCGP